MDENKKKYLAELSDISSNYFLTPKKVYSLYQQTTTTKFSASPFSNIFPNLKSKNNLKRINDPRIKSRPVTSKSCNKLETSETKKVLIKDQTGYYEDFKKFIDSLSHMKSLCNELNINYLIANSGGLDRASEEWITEVDSEDFDKDTLVAFVSKLTIVIREYIKPNTDCKNIEVLWRAIIKAIDCYITSSENQLLRSKKDHEDLSDFKIHQMQNKYEQLQTDFSEKTAELNQELEYRKQKIISLELDLGVKSRTIEEKNRQIHEMNSFESRTYTMYRLKRMVKGLTDFISETEIEQEKQEKTLSGISKILEISEQLRKPPTIQTKSIQTLCTAPTNILNIKELPTPLLSLNPLYYFAKPSEKFILITDQGLLDFCEEVLRKDVVGTYPQVFIAKALEDGKSPQFVHEMIKKLESLEKIGVKWPTIYKKLLEINYNPLGKLWSFTKNLDMGLNLSKFIYFTEFHIAISLLYKLFKNQGHIVNKILNDIEFLEPIEENKCFQKSKFSEIELTLIKLAYNIKKNNISIKNILLDSNYGENSMISKKVFFRLIKTLYISANESMCEEIWSLLAGSEYLQINFKSLMKKINLNLQLEKSKRLYVDKFDLMLRIIGQWEDKQEIVLQKIYEFGPETSLQDIAKEFYDLQVDVTQEFLLDLFLQRKGVPRTLMDSFSCIDLIQFPVDHKNSKEKNKTCKTKTL